MTDPREITVIPLHRVREFLGRIPTPDDLDQMAIKGVYLSPEDCLLFEVFESYHNIPERFLP